MNDPEIRRVAPGKPGIELAQEREDGMAKVMNEEQRKKRREYQRAYQARKRAAENAQGGGHSVKKRAAKAAPRAAASAAVAEPAMRLSVGQATVEIAPDGKSILIRLR